MQYCPHYIEPTFNFANRGPSCEMTVLVHFSNISERSKSHRFARINQNHTYFLIGNSQSFGAEPPQSVDIKNAHQTFVAHPTNYKFLIILFSNLVIVYRNEQVSATTELHTLVKKPFY